MNIYNIDVEKKYQGIFVLAAFLACLVVGTMGYHLIEDWPILDALYMTVITITTVGFHEENPLSPPGKVFTIFLIFFGFGICIYTLSNITSLIMRGELINWIRRYFMNAKVELFDDHIIVCGYGRMGKVVCEHLQRRKIPFVVIEKDKSRVPPLTEVVYPIICGNSGSEDCLSKAAIQKAAGLISVVSSDAENAFTIMTARRMRSELHIVSRCIDPNNHSKLKMAGANQVISPYELSGNRITQAALHPTMVELVDFIEDLDESGIEMADIVIPESSKLEGEALCSEVVSQMGVMVVGIKKQGGDFEFHPKSDTVIRKNDHLVIVGPRANIERTVNSNEN